MAQIDKASPSLVGRALPPILVGEGEQAERPSGTTSGAGACICLPTYDEAENLKAVVAEIRAAIPLAQVLVIDDASPDGTGQLAEALAQADPLVSVLHRPHKEGLGPAYLAGFNWALQGGFGAVVEMDADGSHDPEELPALLAALGRSDVVIGSRWVPGARVLGWPRRRLLLSWVANAYARAALGLPVSDTTGGFRAYRAEALRALRLGSVHSRGYCFQVDLTRRAFEAGFRLVEVPITFSERRGGRSKMSLAVVGEAGLKVTLWALRARLCAALSPLASPRPCPSSVRRHEVVA